MKTTDTSENNIYNCQRGELVLLAPPSTAGCPYLMTFTPFGEPAELAIKLSDCSKETRTGGRSWHFHPHTERNQHPERSTWWTQPFAPLGLVRLRTQEALVPTMLSEAAILTSIVFRFPELGLVIGKCLQDLSNSSTQDRARCDIERTIGMLDGTLTDLVELQHLLVCATESVECTTR